MIFAKVALETTDSAKKKRNRQSARKAYDTVVKLSAKIHLNESDARSLSQHLQQLKSDLVALGESF